MNSREAGVCAGAHVRNDVADTLCSGHPSPSTKAGGVDELNPTSSQDQQAGELSLTERPVGGWPGRSRKTGQVLLGDLGLGVTT